MSSLSKFRKYIRSLIQEQTDVVTQQLSQDELNEIFMGYIQAAFFTEEERLNDEMISLNPEEEEDDSDEGENELDKLVRLTNQMNEKQFTSFCKDDIDNDSMIQAYVDIKQFLMLAGPSAYQAISEMGLSQLGHDIWLSRNHHGSGFFDHSYDYEVEKTLTDAAHTLKQVDMYIGDDMKLHFSNAH